MASKASTVRSESAPAYKASVDTLPESALSEDDAIIARAMHILGERCRRKSGPMTDPLCMKRYLMLRFAELPHEVFSLISLDSLHRIIEIDELFRGTIDGVSVHPREVVKQALVRNAATVVFAHNHPSGKPKPSDADRRLTQRLKDALALIDVRVLDHFVVGCDSAVSFAERGLI